MLRELAEARGWTVRAPVRPAPEPYDSGQRTYLTIHTGPARPAGPPDRT
jgi:hypothetical protein